MVPETFQFTVVGRIFNNQPAETVAVMRVEADSPVNAIHAANRQVVEDYDESVTFMVLAILEGWPRDYLNPDQDPAEKGAWEDELDNYFLKGGIGWMSAPKS